jgi:endonuclease G
MYIKRILVLLTLFVVGSGVSYAQEGLRVVAGEWEMVKMETKLLSQKDDHLLEQKTLTKPEEFKHVTGFIPVKIAVQGETCNITTARGFIETGRYKLETPRAVRLPEREQATLQAGLVIGKLQIPLEVTVTVGKGRGLGAPPAAFPVGDGSALGDDIADDEDDSSGDEVEAVAADYRDRKGYQPGFIGDGFEVPLPVVTRNVQDVLEFEFEGKKETELRYQHFTVVMNKKRRLCIYSAVNIDGKLSKKSKRVEWKFDPRLPKEMQIKNECYGNPPKFSRGHMTRREDPGWGTAANAKRGNEDSMHVTNAAPQMQAFNSPIWLGLEDYALQNAREDDMKISVITGPYLKRNDPVRFGVRVPVSFWKIIVFIHDETGELCATGYEMSQKQSLPPPEEEFVFGQFTSQQLGITTQVPIRSIAERAGLDFGVLAEIDPLASDEESVDGGAAAGVPLAALESIRFVR